LRGTCIKTCGWRTSFYPYWKKLLDYTVTPSGEGWKITISIPPDVAIKEILKWKQELNLFLFQEFDDNTAGM
jgi:hypothetical protein